jgi:hypothetical protein
VTWIVRMVGGCLGAALVLGACGDTRIGEAQEENARRADAICLEAQDAVGRTLGDEPAKEFEAIRAAADKLEALDAPSQDEHEFDLLVDQMNNFWLQLSDLKEATEVNDRPRAQRALERARGTNDQIANLADDYGATQCAEGFGRA